MDVRDEFLQAIFVFSPFYYFSREFSSNVTV